MACIVKTKRGSSVKIRFVIDLRRFGVKGLTHVAQKVILARVKDLAISIVDFLVASDKSKPSVIDLGYIDFTNTLHTLTVREHEEGYLAFQTDCVWYTDRVIPFGLASSPLRSSYPTCG